MYVYRLVPDSQPTGPIYMASKKRKAVAADTPQAACDVFVLESESCYDGHSDIKVIGCFGKWVDLVAKVKETMLKEPIELFEQFKFVDKITTSIEDKYLKKEWPYRHGLGIARIEDEDCLYTFSLRVHRTSLQ